MPQANSLPPGVRKPLPLIPDVIALIVAIAAAVFALYHLLDKGGAPQADDSPAAVAIGSADPTRDAYNQQDFTEPKAK